MPTPPCALSLSGSTSASYAEDGSGSVGSYTATASYCGSLNWSLSGIDDAAFQLSGSGLSRSLRFSSSPNYESPTDRPAPGIPTEAGNNVYKVKVKVKASGAGQPSKTKSVTVTVTNVDEPPIVSLSSSSPQVGTALTVTLSDPDGGISNTSWQWQASNTSPAAWVNRGTGSSYTPTDSDIGYSLRARASYTDAHGSGKSARSGTVGPVPTPPCNLSLSGSTSASYAENGSGSVGSYTATTSYCGSLNWSLSGIDDAAFQLSGSGLSRSLRFSSSPNYESPTDRPAPGIPTEAGNNVYKVKVKVKASGAGQPSKTKSVTVTVTNVDEPPIVSLSSSSPQVGTALTVTLSDPDGGISNTSWQWQASNTSPAAWVNRGTGSSYTPTSSDIGYSLRARASYTDAHGSGKSARSGTVGPVPTPPCNLSLSGSTSASYAENGSGSVGSYTATTSYCGSLNWSLSGTDSGDFQLSGSGSSRSLRFSSSPNYESPTDRPAPGIPTEAGNNVYKVKVKVKASGAGQASKTKSVTVTVTNVDEAGSVSLSSSSPKVGTSLTATLRDPDGGIRNTSWQWQASNTSPAAWVNRGTSSSYTPTSSDVGFVLRARASYTDGHGSGKSVRSGTTGQVRHPARVPDAPSGFSHGRLSATQLRVGWDAPANNGSAITAYYWSRRVGSFWTNETSTGTSTYFTDTASNTVAHTYRVRAENGVGFGAYGQYTVASEELSARFKALAAVADSTGFAVLPVPNPFNPSTTLHFQLPEAGPVSLTIYNMAGQGVATLLQGHYLEAGVHARVWEGRDDHGRTASSGLYLYRLATQGGVLLGKLALIR